MPNKCAAVGCRSNYKVSLEEQENPVAQYTPVFKFPSGPGNAERRKKWIQFTHREDWEPGKSSVLCMNHFAEKYRKTNDSGRVSLSKDSIPTRQCEALPKHLNFKEVTARIPVGVRVAQKDAIGNSFNEFKENILKRLDYGTWHMEVTEAFVAFYICDFTSGPTVRKCIKIDGNFKLEVFIDKVEKKEACIDKIDRWTRLQEVLQRYETDIAEDVESPISKCTRIIKEEFAELVHQYTLAEHDEDDMKVKRIKFIAEQFNLAIAGRQRYSTDLLVWSFMISLNSSSTYSA